MKTKTLVICSGGLDSVTLAYLVAKERELSAVLSFDYGQRHQKEVEYAEHCASVLGAPYQLIDITSVGKVLTGSALTDNIDVPDGHYAEESMKSTVVPNRNTIMLSIAFGMAVSIGADSVAAAVHSGDHFIYPDCRPDFIKSFESMQKLALDGLAEIELYTPFVHSSKADIVTTGQRVNVPFADTWSCYKGLDQHCGRCGTCVERREAFHLAGVSDPTHYEDPDFWQSVT
ncbi:MAG: 7-cyano-7-deazaguanine synthase QueC [Gammaproteobacteria bacterium]|jgi:7-cyano-7-deazaguanine synthase|nr:7-cyano-7-deazaguanine synthase QueC [Gammaproteobacteria bacterium]MBT3723101.1 7-cyano-7-deazaguanine synthase QueC [Gammaproteobacteria bacterium]MBT4075820.1 7-cyano-7-deazaguanine synthase QueC [Gammaproteobacteria bacterium]MBT4192740.1 7-cyano-7-deazaguanine synthase QueC [Gammaproteobacteria bacterium]MBT4448432.1 7-cyano-7-deazaguanine synthase QueC [Gammaproteobacteria bacterium]